MSTRDRLLVMWNLLEEVERAIGLVRTEIGAALRLIPESTDYGPLPEDINDVFPGEERSV